MAYHVRQDDPTINFIRQPDVFISYSSKNKKFVTKFSEDLNFCGIDAWFDDWEIKVGDSLLEKLSKAIENSKFIALLINNDFNNSKWVTNELKQAFAREMREGRNLILPILTEKVTVPSFIEDKVHIDLTVNYYRGFSKMIGIMHGLTARSINDSIRYVNPKNINDAMKVLEYCGVEPNMVIDKNIFKEIVAAGGKVYDENKVSFYPDRVLNSKQAVSQRTKEYIRKISDP